MEWYCFQHLVVDFVVVVAAAVVVVGKLGFVATCLPRFVECKWFVMLRAKNLLLGCCCKQ